MTILLKSEFELWENKTLLEYPHKVSISNESYDRNSLNTIWKWAADRFGRDTFVWSAGGRFYFIEYDNAVMFALRWS